MNTRRRLLFGAASALGLAACGGLPQKSAEAPARPLVARKPRIALALGGGAARGFAHIGVIKALETNGIVPDFVVGTSAGSVVGALYAAGHGPFELQRLAIQLDESAITDWSLFDRGVIKGEALERFINTNVGNKPIEGLKRRFAAVATDLQSGEPIVFQRGNTGTAVRASASIPGVFPPVLVSGREYVDGGLVAPIPVREARSLGADIIIAVDISGRQSGKKNQGTADVLLDTISIMGGALGKVELAGADVIIRPELRGVPATNFQQRHEAILAGEQAGFAAVARIKDALAAWERKNG
jgi:NTE family protein